MLRFLSHMLITAVLAPAAGGAVFAFCFADWHDAKLLSRLFGSLLGGFVLLSFIWFATVPVGLLTSLLCLAISRYGIRNRILWGTGGGAFGLLFGQFIADWAHMSLIISLASGVCIGAVSGLALREVWCSGKETTTRNDGGGIYS
ncbi:MAG: hypothetical protein NUV77_25165 [Thermoguttaceae bacterium]|jgi:hypothetical protein|nr:hypothetical protein [Thermoguttaceae bacterium]